MSPLVSIIIPSYNHQDYVLEAIRSVLQQDWPAIDLIVIDDGSSDASASLINDFYNAHGGFRYISRENRGLVNTLAEGLDLAKGKYFCELASDDFLPANSISKRASFLEQHPEHTAVFTDGFAIRNNAVTREHLVNKSRYTMFHCNDPIPSILQSKGPIFATGLFNTGQLVDAGGFDNINFHYYEDLDTPVRVCLAGKIGYIHEPLFYRRYHDTNVSTTTSHIRIEKVLYFGKLLRNPLMQPYLKLLNKCYISAQISLAKSILKNSNPSQKEINLLRSAWPYAFYNPKLLWYLLRTYRNF